MAAFETAFAKTSAHEGGYANNARDRGGETFRGIARNFWPGWKGWPIIDEARGAGRDVNKLKNGKLDGLVADFYTDNFWRPLGLDKIKSEAVASELFDTGVNMGVKVAGRFLQEALGLMGENLSIDGVVGAKTLAAANGADDEVLVRLLNLLQGAKYLDIVRRDPSQRVFLRGWLRRTDAAKDLGKAE